MKSVNSNPCWNPQIWTTATAKWVVPCLSHGSFMEIRFLLPAPDEPCQSGTLTQQPKQRRITAHYHRLAGSADVACLHLGSSLEQAVDLTGSRQTVCRISLSTVQLLASSGGVRHACRKSCRILTRWFHGVDAGGGESWRRWAQECKEFV